jgi:hypothetical protein
MVPVSKRLRSPTLHTRTHLRVAQPQRSCGPHLVVQRVHVDTQGAVRVKVHETLLVRVCAVRGGSRTRREQQQTAAREQHGH